MMKIYRIIGFLLASVLAVIWLVPYGWVLVNSFLLPVSASRSTIGFGLENFRSVLVAAPFGQYFINSVLMTAGILTLQFITMTLASYAFARLRFFGSDAVFILLLLQIVIPNDILIVPNYTTIVRLGSMNTLIGIMLPFFGSAFGIFLLRQTFKSIPPDFEEAAEIDGCSLFCRLWHVYIPMSQPAYIAFALVSVSTHWNDFLWPLIVTNSDLVRPMTVGLAMFATSFETGAQWGEVSAATLLVTLPLMVLFIAFQKKFIESFTYSSGLK